MADGFLPIPQDFHDPDDPLWADPAWLGAYVHLQMASCWGIYHVEHNGESYRLKPGQILFSQRRFAEEVGWGRTRTRSFIQHLEERDLISYPNGRNHQGSYIVQLTDCWYLREGGVPPTVPRDPENRTTRFSPKPPILREIEEGGSENRTTRSRKPYHQPCHEIPVYLQKGWGGVPRDHRSKPPYLRDLAYRGPPGRTTPGRAGAIDEYIDKYITPYGYGPTDAHTREDDQDEEDIDPSEAAAKLFDLLCQVGYLGHEPSGPGRQEQLNILEQLVEERSVEEVRDAIKGARHSWPYSEEENTPYDAEVVRAKFDIYLASYRQRPEIQQKGQKRAQEDDQDQGKAHEDQGKAHEEDYELRRQQWAEEIDQRFQQEDPEVRDRIRREAYDATPGKGRLSDHTREAILRSTVRRIYGQEIGQPPP